MASVKEGVIRMFNGRMVDVFNLQPEDVVPINFIHSLSLINRFTGASPWPVSVMQHSIMIARYIANEYDPKNMHSGPTMYREYQHESEIKHKLVDEWYQFRRAGFVHDWSEALFNDIASPVKKEFTTYKMHEKRALKVIFDTLNIPMEYLARVDPIDKQIYRDEVNSTWGKLNDPYDTDRNGLGVVYTEQPWRDVRLEGIKLYQHLFPSGPYLGAVVL